MKGLDLPLWTNSWILFPVRNCLQSMTALSFVRHWKYFNTGENIQVLSNRFQRDPCKKRRIIQMTEIYLCDDEHIWIEQMEQAVLDFMISSDWALTVTCKTSAPRELLEQLLHPYESQRHSFVWHVYINSLYRNSLATF